MATESTRPQYADDASEIRAFLEVLIGDFMDGFIELRPIKPDGQPGRQRFIPVGEIDDAIERILELRDSADVYIGAVPRAEEKGTGESVRAVHCLWADIDSEESVRAADDFALSPSLSVLSGTEGNRHNYYLLDERIEPEYAERLTLALAKELRSDKRVADRARILRPPTTFNHKHKPLTRTRLIACDRERRYSVAEVVEALGESIGIGSEPTKTSSGKKPQKVSNRTERVLDLLEGVHRSGNGWKALCPAHGDTRPSLSVGESEDGRCLVNCFAGCSERQILTAIGLTKEDLMPAKKKDRAASRLLDLAEGAGVEPFVSPGGETYIAIKVSGHNETWPLASVEAGRWLRQLHYEAHQEALADETVASAIATLDARAQFEGIEYEVHRRIAGGPDRVVIDRGDKDWTAISVTASGWEVVDDHDTHFHRDRSILELPIPRPGNIEDLREFANCANDRSWMMLVGFAVMCFHPAGPYPIAYPTGEQGSAKSTLSRLIASLVDPRKAPLIMGAPPVRDLASMASSVRLVGFDNVSKISPNLSDALCQLATGAGYRARQLYTDAEPFILEFKRPILLNGIGQVANRPDLLDRVALIELSPISPENRRTESEFQAAWEVARPGILGALLDGVSAALSHADEVEVPGYPRMADFARWGEAAGRAFGWEPGAFTEALEGSRGDLLEGSADAYPEIGVLLDFMEERETWTGSASELLAELTRIADDTIGTGGRHWPKRADTLSNRLIQHAPLLRDHGLEIKRWREAGGKRNRRITIDRDTGTQGDAS